MSSSYHSYQRRLSKKSSVRSTHTTSEHARRMYTPRRKSSLKQREVLANSQHKFLDAAFFCRIKYMENENMIALVAAMIACFSINKLDAFTLDELNDIGRCETSLTLIHGIVNLSVVIAGGCIAAIIFLLNTKDFGLLSTVQNSYSETTLENFDVRRRKTKFMRKRMVRMISALAVFYILSFCIKPSFWCDFRIVGIFASGFVLLGFLFFLFLCQKIRKLQENRGSSECLSKGTRNDETRELVSSDPDASSCSKDSFARSNFCTIERSHYNIKEPRQVNPGISYKSQDIKKRRRLTVKQRVEFGEDLHRQSFELKRDRQLEMTKINSVHVGSAGSTLTGAKKRAWNLKKKKHRESQTVWRESCTAEPQYVRSSSNSHSTCHKSSKKQSIKSRKYRSEERHNSWNSLFNEANRMESSSEILSKWLENKEDVTDTEKQVVAPAVTESWSEKPEKLCPGKSDDQTDQSADDSIFWIPSSGDNVDNKGNKYSDLLNANTSHQNSDTRTSKQKPNDRANVMEQDVVKFFEQKANIGQDMNVDPTIISPEKSPKHQRALNESPNKISEPSLVSLKRQQHVNGKDKKIAKQRSNEEIEEFVMSSSSETIDADYGDVRKMPYDLHKQVVSQGESKSNSPGVSIKSYPKQNVCPKEKKILPNTKIPEFSPRSWEVLEEGWESSRIPRRSKSGKKMSQSIVAYEKTSVGSETDSDPYTKSVNMNTEVEHYSSSHSEYGSDSTHQYRRSNLESNCAQFTMDSLSDLSEVKYSEKEKDGFGVNLDAGGDSMVKPEKAAANVKDSSDYTPHNPAFRPEVQLRGIDVNSVELIS